MWPNELNSVKTGSNWAHFTCLRTPNGPRSLLEKRVTTGSKWAKNTCLGIPNGPVSLLGNCVFDPFFTHFWSQNGPFSRHFGILHGPERVTTGSKRSKNSCLSIPSGLGTTLEKMIFSAPGTVVDPPLAPTVRGLCCLAAPPSEH